MKKVDINTKNLSNVFLHYTSKENIDSIFEKGLIPQIGSSALAIEKTKKVFFTIGIDGALVLIDSWIRGLIMKLSVDMPGTKWDVPMYKFSTFIAKLPIRPNFIINFIIESSLKNEKMKKKAFKQMEEILNNSVYLLLDLEENIDFSYNDIDEIKSGKWDKKLLNMIYAYKANNSKKKQEYWNMHTFTNKIIFPDKISLLQLKESTNMMDIVQYFFSITTLKRKKVPYLYEFFEYLNDNEGEN